MLPDVDHMDVGARQENLAVRGEPILLQLCVVPAYALTIHKVQQGRNPFVQWKLVIFPKRKFCLEPPVLDHRISALLKGASPVNQASCFGLPRRRLCSGAGPDEKKEILPHNQK